jgi:outer membrane protein assembly factor BamB
VSCQACNAASTAFDGHSITGVGTPGGELFSLGRDDGTPDWMSPIADGAHYQSTSTADGVVYTLDGNGFLDVLDAATGDTIARRPLSADAGVPVEGLTSSGVAIAEHRVFAAGAMLPDATGSGQSGVIVAYKSG